MMNLQDNSDTSAASSFAPVRPYRIPLSEAVLMLPFQRFPLLDEVWADEDTPVATEVVRP